ncbi:hypothetical protein KIW84_012343 [Lathyrus oleraceus]|uniref:Uncharacterized protein n=1 Tax=Pisum sativum TaxID=3888 RepID=A0A9D5BH92_PEA|nr:hypothetical protein KIW84_012343 [Pisum sativum]
MEEIDESSHASKNRTSLQDIGWVFGDYISDQDHIDDVLNGLPKEYNTFFMQVYGHLDPSTMYDVEVDVARIIENEIKLVAESGRQIGPPLVFPALIMAIYAHGRVNTPLQMQIREHNEDHQIASRDQFLAHANWPEGMPFSREEEVGHEEEGDDESCSDDEE